MKKYTFSISKEGYEATDPLANHKLLDADYPFFKFHDDITGSVTFAPGDTHQSTDLNHSLGYVPAFIAYYQDSDGKLNFIPDLPYPWGLGPGEVRAYPYAYADSTKIRCGVQFIGGTYNQYGASNCYMLYDDRLDSTIGMRVGNDSGDLNGACLFTGVDVPQGVSITEAILAVAVGAKGAGAGNLEANIYGIDEDNTADFSSDPMGRPRTSAVNTDSWSLPPVGEYSNHNVTSLVQEIVNRAGWAGSNMGFLLFNDGSPADVWIEDDINVTIDTQLTIKYGSNITLNFRAIIFKDKIA